MDKNTFGKTPAAMYLVRILDEIDDPVLNRSVGRRITSTNNGVRDLVIAYENNFLPSKTVANCLRLMRQEIANDVDCCFGGYVIVDQLRRNMQIGVIKRGLRLCEISRKAERVMMNPDHRSCERTIQDFCGGVTVEYKFKDSNSGKTYDAGCYVTYDGETTPEKIVAHHLLASVDDITPEVLIERSNRRCFRLGKPHMMGWI